MEQAFQELKKLGHQKKKPMKIFKYSLCGLFTATFFLAACGDDVTKITEVTNSGLEVVASADSLGKCAEEISGEMKFVSKENAVYVCADSAWQNISAATKVSCATELLADSSGYKIICRDDSVGVVFNGNDGKKGETGMAGTSCTVTKSPLLDSDFGGGYFVVCGSDTVGMLVSGREGENCSLTDNGDGSVTQVCGASEVTLYKGFCGGKPFDPDSSFCVADSLYSLCNGDWFEPEEQFCHEKTLYEKCLGKVYDPQDSVCYEERLFGFFEDARNGQVYRIVTIGTQTWMAENLNYVYMPDTSSFCYNNSADSCAKYGRYYLWSAAVDSAARFTKNGEGCGLGKTCSPTYPIRGICPAGWHLPSNAEWDTLEMFVADSLFGGNKDSVGYALKSTSGWNDYEGSSGNGSDAFGFGAIPAGRISSGFASRGFVLDIFNAANFWSSTEMGGGGVYDRYLSFRFTSLFLGGVGMYEAMSIRCIKD